MGITKPFNSLSLSLFTLLLASCVSVNLPSTSGHKAEKVSYLEPSDPFSEITAKDSDQAWISAENGNTISYISDCNNPVDPPLSQLENEILGVLNNQKTISSNQINFNSREALQTVAQGIVDGVLVKMKLVTFKKNNCSYSLVYGGVESKFDLEVQHFEKFLKEFKAP